MVKDELFQERVVRVETPSAHFTLLRNAAGDFLGVSDTNELATFDYTDDKAIWEQVKGTIGVNLVIFRCVLKSSKGRIFSTAFLQSVCVLKCAFYVFQGFNDCLC